MVCSWKAKATRHWSETSSNSSSILSLERAISFSSRLVSRASHAAEAPAGQRHGLDQVHFDGVGGAVGILVGLEELQEVLFGFAGEYVGIGGQAVLEEHFGKSFFCLPGVLGPRDFFAVLAGGVRFGLRCHGYGIASGAERFGAWVREVGIPKGVGGWGGV